jgi:hypothetical protein
VEAVNIYAVKWHRGDEITEGIKHAGNFYHLVKGHALEVGD